LDRRSLARGMAAASVALVTGLAHGDAAWPSRAVRVVVPFPPGGATDLAARVITERLQAQFGQPFIVENRGGGGGQIGTEQVSKARPDGHTLLFTNSGTLSYAQVTSRLNYAPQKDFSAIALVGTYSLVLVVHPAVPATNLQELVAHARRLPGKLNYSSSGMGSGTQFAGELFKQSTGTSIVHVPYKGAAPALQDVVAGQVEMTFDAQAVPHVLAGRLRALGVTGRQRDPRLPQVPTLAELGLRDFNVEAFLALLGPAGLPADIVTRLNAAVNATLGEERARQRLIELGVVLGGGAPEGVMTQMAADTEAYRRIAGEARLKFD